MLVLVTMTVVIVVALGVIAALMISRRSLGDWHRHITRTSRTVVKDWHHAGQGIRRAARRLRRSPRGDQVATGDDRRPVEPHDDEQPRVSPHVTSLDVVWMEEAREGSAYLRADEIATRDGRRAYRRGA